MLFIVSHYRDQVAWLESGEEVVRNIDAAAGHESYIDKKMGYGVESVGLVEATETETTALRLLQLLFRRNLSLHR